MSGITFLFDPTKCPGNRVDPAHIKIGGEFLKHDDDYKVASTAYLAISGKDGFHCMLPNKVILTEDENPPISVMVQNHFASVAQRRELGAGAHIHRQSLLMLSRREGIAKQFLKKIGKEASALRNIHCDGGLKQISISLSDLEMECLDIAPSVEGRIKKVNKEEISRLENERNLHECVHQRLGPNGRYPREKMTEIEANFKLFDTYNDGTISRPELAVALELERNYVPVRR